MGGDEARGYAALERDAREGDLKRDYPRIMKNVLTSLRPANRSESKSSAFRLAGNEDQTVFSCPLVCVRCAGISADGRTRCKRNTCKALPFCNQHALKYLGVEVRQTADVGLGLFAKKRLRRTPDDAVVFEAGDLVAWYIGERLGAPFRDAQVLKNDRYGNNDAPYVWEHTSHRMWDAACVRGIASYANSGARRGLGTNASIRHAPRNDWDQRMGAVGDGEFPGDIHPFPRIMADREIRHGQEIIVGYGPSYRYSDNHVTGRVRPFPPAGTVSLYYPFFPEDLDDDDGGDESKGDAEEPNEEREREAEASGGHAALVLGMREVNARRLREVDTDRTWESHSQEIRDTKRVRQLRAELGGVVATVSDARQGLVEADESDHHYRLSWLSGERGAKSFASQWSSKQHPRFGMVLIDYFRFPVAYFRNIIIPIFEKGGFLHRLYSRGVLDPAVVVYLPRVVGATDELMSGDFFRETFEVLNMVADQNNPLFHATQSMIGDRSIGDLAREQTVSSFYRLRFREKEVAESGRGESSKSRKRRR